uniref:NudC domain-containing protein 1 n=1 Tax=Evadne anonyx TaxID=141404 RepID=A0A9N6ZFD9_9CRUS|nr:EOG090X08S2 [Evadne anonyx]
MAEFIDLRPNKELLNANFKGYTLSLEPLPVYKHDLPVGVEHLCPSNEQFSYQHAKTFGYHNHLYSDPWNTEFAFYMSKDLQVFRASILSLTGQNPKIEGVGNIPRPRGSQFFNASLSFSSPTLAIASDGGGSLFILDTHDRSLSNPILWQVKIFGKEKPFQVLHSYLDETEKDGSLDLHVLLLRVQAYDDVETQVPLSALGFIARETPFITTIEYVTFSNRTGHWAFKQLKRIAVPRQIDYASILSPGKSLCFIAQEPLAIIYDSYQSIKVPQSDITDEPIYQWYEDPEEVKLWLSFDKNTSKRDVAVEITNTSIKVTYKDQVKVQGNLFEKISTDSSLWTLSDGKLEIILSKCVKALDWDCLIQHDSAGMKVSDAQAAHEWHQRLINRTTEEMETGRAPLFLNDEFEECDSVSDEMILFRFDAESNQFSHKAFLGSHKLLFTTTPASNAAPAFCLRDGVDGLIWQPMADEELVENENKWGCRHTTALHAFGYIQASKEHRKFTVCPPNNMYVAVCDVLRHVYIYRQPGCPSTGVQMVHRPSGRRIANVARSQLLSFDHNEEFLGTLATDAFLVILTASSLTAVRINDD